MNMYGRNWLAATMVVAALGCTAANQRGSARPNILLIVADDMGYSDVGVYGGEILTPNIDALAQQGVLFAQFHVAPNCGPTRGAMLSGVDYHIAGLGGNPDERRRIRGQLLALGGPRSGLERCGWRFELSPRGGGQSHA